MTTNQQDVATGSVTRVVDTIEDAEHTVLQAVRKFVDTVDGVFPDVGEDGPRRKIIDSAFKMVEQLVGASNKLTTDIVKVTGDALEELGGSTTTKR